MPGIVTAGSGQPWETALVAALGQPGAPAAVVRRAADVADVVATSSTGQVEVAVVSAYMRHLDGEIIDQLRTLGVATVAVYRSGDDRVEAVLRRIGVAGTAPDALDPAALIAVIMRAMTGADDDGGEPNSATDPGMTDDLPTAGSDPFASVLPQPRLGPDESSGPSEAGSAADGSDDVIPDRGGVSSRVGEAGDHGASGRPSEMANRFVPDRGPAHRRRKNDSERVARARTRLRSRVRPGDAARDRVASGVAAPGGPSLPPPRRMQPSRTVAVWGPGGAPGRTTVAMGLADSLSRRGLSVVLVDADVYGGVLASAFGLLDESAGLAGACRLASTGRLDEESLADLCWRVTEYLTVLTGISRADRWPEVKPSAMTAVLSCAAKLADVVVVDCAAVLETDEEISFDTLAPRRNGATIAAIRAADRIVAVASADPVGMERLARGFVEVVDVSEATPVAVVFNKVRGTAANPAELTDAALRYCGVEPVAFLPEDRAAVDLAWQRGIAVSEASPRSPLVAALDAFADAMSAEERGSRPISAAPPTAVPR